MKFSPMKDQVLPDVDMLYLGGGYPELHGEALAGESHNANSNPEICPSGVGRSLRNAVG